MKRMYMLVLMNRKAKPKNYGSIVLDLKTYPFMLNVFSHPNQLDVYFQF